jgi:hypothetical protein
MTESIITTTTRTSDVTLAAQIAFVKLLIEDMWPDNPHSPHLAKMRAVLASLKTAQFTTTRSPAGERESGLTAYPSDVCSDATRSPDSRPAIRYIAERGSGSNGTAYNQRDYEVIDQDRVAGRRVVGRANRADAQLIAWALNQTREF